MDRLTSVVAYSVCAVALGVVAAWLHFPWWGLPTTFGLVIFALYASTSGLPISFKPFLVGFALFLTLGGAALAVATSNGVSLEALTKDHSLYKDVRRLPEYALIALSFAVAAGVSALAQRIFLSGSASRRKGT